MAARTETGGIRSFQEAIAVICLLLDKLGGEVTFTDVEAYAVTSEWRIETRLHEPSRELLMRLHKPPVVIPGEVVEPGPRGIGR